RSRLVDHAERCVPRAGELRPGLDEVLEHRVERQLGREGDPGLDETTEASVRFRHRGHYLRAADPATARDAGTSDRLGQPSIVATRSAIAAGSTRLVVSTRTVSPRSGSGSHSPVRARTAISWATSAS